MASTSLSEADARNYTEVVELPSLGSKSEFFAL